MIFSEKAVFFEETVKNCSSSAIDHFLGNQRRLTQKINLTFFITNKVATGYFII